ncbi:MAG: amino acid ABC transporter substrate-binding protein [Chloroflexi bacterium]|nr:amino acid ABC transporter substrate-binding protein [Chloroflexota bacterium]
MGKAVKFLPVLSLILATLVVAALIAGCSAPATAPQAPAAKETKPAAEAKPTAESKPAATKAAASTPAAAKSGAPETIKIGAVVPLTGRYAALGSQVKPGYEFAVEDINKAGGVEVAEYGKKIPLELKMLDDESDPAKTVQRLETLNSSENVWVYLGGAGSDLHAAGAAIADKNKTPYLGIAFALWDIHQKGYKYLFSPFPKSPDLARESFALANSAPQGQRPAKYAIFQEKTDWGLEMTNEWKKAAPAAGANIAFIGEYAPGSKDFSDMILKAKSAGADAVLALPNPPDGMAIFKQMKELGFNAKYYFIVRAPDGPTWAQNLKQDGDYAVVGAGWHNGAQFPGVKELNAKFQAQFNRPADVLTGPSYACVQIAAEAIKKAGKLDREAIRNAMAALKMDTVVGPVSFRPDGTGDVQTILAQWQNQKQELVWPANMATKPFAYPAKPWNER